MAPELSQMIYNVPISKGFFPPLNDLPLADVAQHLVTLLDGLEFMPQDISKRGNKIG